MGTILKLLKETKIDLTNTLLVPSGGVGNLGNLYDLSPKDFLRFAKQDLKEKDDRGIINCLTNSKRAIDCQTDEALEKLGINPNDFNKLVVDFASCFESEADIPIKLKIIQALNLAPNILISKTRNLRNKLEHLYKIPSIEEAKEALDVADLFLRSVDGKFRMLTTEFSLTDESNYKIKEKSWEFKNGIFFNFDNEKPEFTIWKIMNSERTEILNLNLSEPEYCGLLRLMISIDDDFEIEDSLKAILFLIGHPIPQDKVSIYQA